MTPTNVESLDAIDLVDGLSVKLEQARILAWNLSDHIEDAPQARNPRVAGELATIFDELAQAQDLVENLTRKLARCTN